MSLIDVISHASRTNLSYKTRVRIKKSVKLGFLGFWLFVLLFPLLWVITVSFSTSDFYGSRTLDLVPKPDQLTTANWDILTHPDVMQMMFNTLTIAVGVILLTTVVSTIAGYGLTRYEFPFKITFARIIIFGYMFSPIALAVPMYIIFRSLNLLNTYVGGIIAISTVSIPFSVWLMWQMFQTVPIEKEEAAWLVGAPRRKTLVEIAIPAVRSGIFAVAIFSFGMVWVNFTYTTILLPDTQALTIAPGLVQLSQQGYFISEGDLMAIAAITTIIPIAITYIMYDYLLTGFRLR